MNNCKYQLIYNNCVFGANTKKDINSKIKSEKLKEYVILKYGIKVKDTRINPFNTAKETIKI